MTPRIAWRAFHKSHQPKGPDHPLQISKEMKISPGLLIVTTVNPCYNHHTDHYPLPNQTCDNRRFRLDWQKNCYPRHYAPLLFGRPSSKSVHCWPSYSHFCLEYTCPRPGASSYSSWSYCPLGRSQVYTYADHRTCSIARQPPGRLLRRAAELLFHSSQRTGSTTIPSIGMVLAFRYRPPYPRPSCVRSPQYSAWTWYHILYTSRRSGIAEWRSLRRRHARSFYLSQNWKSRMILRECRAIGNFVASISPWFCCHCSQCWCFRSRAPLCRSGVTRSRGGDRGTALLLQYRASACQPLSEASGHALLPRLGGQRTKCRYGSRNRRYSCIFETGNSLPKLGH